MGTHLAGKPLGLRRDERDRRARRQSSRRAIRCSKRSCTDRESQRIWTPDRPWQRFRRAEPLPTQLPARTPRDNRRPSDSATCVMSCMPTLAWFATERGLREALARIAELETARDPKGRTAQPARGRPADRRSGTRRAPRAGEATIAATIQGVMQPLRNVPSRGFAASLEPIAEIRGAAGSSGAARRSRTRRRYHDRCARRRGAAGARWRASSRGGRHRGRFRRRRARISLSSTTAAEFERALPTAVPLTPGKRLPRFEVRRARF